MTGTMANCTQCGAPYGDDETNCKYCNTPLPKQLPKPQNTAVYGNFQNVYSDADPAWPVRNRIAAGVLAIIFCYLGIHHFYTRRYALGIVSIFFCFSYIPALCNFIEGIRILIMDDQAFQTKYRCRVN